jgi:allantoin racemase
MVDVVTLKEGPPAIYSWRDWHAVVDPMCRLVERTDADAYVIACASDPGIEAVRAVTNRPVLGIFRSAAAAAVALNLPMETLLDPDAARAALIAAGRELAAMGAETLILGCTGMAHHRMAVWDAVRLPVIEPAQAAVGLALVALAG